MSTIVTVLAVIGFPMIIFFLIDLSEQRHERRMYERYLHDEYHRKNKNKKHKHHD
jgi:hypothetical protein